MATESNHEVTTKIKDFIYMNFPRARQNSLQADEPIIASGAVESLGLLTIVDYLEGEFGILVSDTDMTEENFGTMNAMADYVERSSRAV